MTISTDYSRNRFGFVPAIAFLIATLALSSATAMAGQAKRERVEGVRNFGRVTERYFRGGEVTPAGVANLARMGVRIIVDLRDEESPGEAEASARHGIKYFKFPMNGHVTPDDKAVNEILSIIESAKEPVYVHCSAGKHRAGTIAALYRMRVQGWTKEQAWAEQQSYGFGPPEEHPELYAYLYRQQAESKPAPEAKVAIAQPAKDNKQDKSSRSNKEDREDDDDDDDKDDDDDDDDDSAKRKMKNSEHASSSRSSDSKTKAAATPKPVTAKTDTAPKMENAAKTAQPAAHAPAALSHNGAYISMAEMIKLARAAGGTGDILKIDLEWDMVRSIATWDVTFASGAEYELEAMTGKVIGTKNKLPSKIAVLVPLDLESDAAKRLASFQDIIKKAEADLGQPVLEMELKRIKGRAETVFEVVVEDGTTVYFDAMTGSKMTGI